MSLLPDLLAGASKLVHAVDPWGTAAQLARVAQAWWQAELPKLGTLAFMVLVGIGPYSVGSASGGGEGGGGDPGGGDPDPDPGEETLITVLTVTENGTDDKADELVTLGLPLAATALPEGKYLRVYDDDGEGGQGAALDALQFDYVSSDGNGAQRLCRLSCLLPNLGEGTTRKLRVVASAVEPPSGTAITAEDVLDTAFRFRVKFDIGGTEYIFDSDDALAAGETFDKDDYSCVVASSGPFGTELFVQGPPKNGTTAHASGDGLRVYAAVRAIKAGSGAVHPSTNPITLVYADVWVLNGAVDRSAPANYYYGYEIERSTSLSDGTLIATDDEDVDGDVIRYSYPRSQPAATLTATGATSTGNKTWSRNSGTWPADIVGAHIVDGTGGAVVRTRNSDTEIGVYVYKALSGTSFTSGNWTIEGIGHAYNVPVPPRRIWVGTKPTNVAIWGDVSSAITADSETPLLYAASTRLLLNYRTTYSSVTHSTTAIDAMRSSDTSRRPLTFLGPQSVNMGELITSIGQGGWADTIGPLPQWCVEGLAKWTKAGRRRIFENAEYWSTWNYAVSPRMAGSPSAGELGVPPRIDGGTEYKWNGAFNGTLINPASNNWWPYSTDTAHHSAALYLPYLLTGDLYWLWSLQRQTTYTCEVSIPSNYNGSGLNKTPWGDATGSDPTMFGSGQDRARAWVHRDAVYMAICTPDNISAKIINPKSYHAQRLEKFQLAAKKYGPEDILNQRPGTNNQPAWLGKGGFAGGVMPVLSMNGEFSANWQHSFVRVIFGITDALGFLNEDGAAFRQWLSDAAVLQNAQDNAIVRTYWADNYWYFINDNVTMTTLPSTWEDIYRRDCLMAAACTGGPGAYRIPSGTVSISDNTVGTSRTITFSNDYFSGGGEWYEGGYIGLTTDGTLSAGDPLFRITSVSPDGKTVTGDVLVAFAASGSLTASHLRIPGPHRLDYNGEYEALDSANDRVQFYVCAAKLDADAGVNVEAMEEIIEYNESRTGYLTTSPNRKAFNIDRWAA